MAWQSGRMRMCVAKIVASLVLSIASTSSFLYVEVAAPLPTQPTSSSQLYVHVRGPAAQRIL
jgi:hypothetical protein